MAITRSDLSTQIQKSTSFPALLATDNANEAYWFLPPTPGSDQLLFYDNSGTVHNWATLGAGLVMVDNVLNTVSTGSSYSEIQEEGTLVGSGNTKINFIGSGITAANAGSSVTSITLDATLNALSQFNTNGLLVQTASDTFAGRTLTGTTNRITITNGDGVSGNPTINISTSFGSSGLSDAANIALLNGNQTFTGDNTFNNNIVMNATATLGTHLMTKAQVEALILDRKASFVDVASTTSLDPSADIFTGAIIDNYMLQTGDRVLLKDSDPSKNGYWDVPVFAPASRSVDMNTAGEVKGSLALVLNGTQMGLIFYTLSDPTTLGTDPVVFTQLATGTINGVGVTDAVTIWQDATTLTNDTNFKYTSGNLVLGHTTPATSTRFTTRGSGTTSSTFGWKHQNSSGTVTAIVADNGQVTLGSGGEVLIASTATNYTNGTAYAISKIGGNLDISSDTSITFAGGGTTSSTPSVLFNTTRQDLSNNQLNARFAGIFSPSGAGTNTYTEIDIAPVINQTTHTGASRSVYIHPTLTSVGSGGHTALEIAASGQRALRTTAGSVQFDLGSDASRDLLFRTTTGILGRIPYGTTGQVLIATTGSDPSWGAVPTAVSEAYWEPTSSSTTVDLDTGTSVKDVDGTNIAFTVPSDLKKLHIYRNGYHQSMTGTLTIRDYTVNTSTHVVTFTVSVEDGEIIKFVKFA